MATTFFPDDQISALARHSVINRLNLRPHGRDMQVAPDMHVRLNLAANVDLTRDRIKISVSAACVVLGATGTLSALLGFPVTGTMLAVTALFLLKLSDVGTD